jgi:RNA polymerase sigma-70 factor, ECF subfamily
LDSVEQFDFSVSNEQLLQECAQQDQESLRELFRRHKGPVYNLLYRTLSSHDDAEEALADVFVKVWRNAKGFRGNSKFTTWLYSIAANTAKDRLRARKGRNEVSCEEVLDWESHISMSAPVSAQESPEQAVMKGLEREVMHRAMAALNEEERLILTLYHLQNCDYSEITRITGIAAYNLKVKLFRARLKLRKLCEQLDREVNEDELRTSTTEPAGLQQRSAEFS